MRSQAASGTCHSSENWTSLLAIIRAALEGDLPGSALPPDRAAKGEKQQAEKLPGDVGSRTHERSTGTRSTRRDRKNQ